MSRTERFGPAVFLLVGALPGGRGRGGGGVVCSSQDQGEDRGQFTGHRFLKLVTRPRERWWDKFLNTRKIPVDQSASL